jgi:uncharacterized protein YidB (DUF937 family)
MLEELINLVKEHAGDAIINNPVIPNQHNDAAIRETASGIIKSLKSQMSGGNKGAITDLLKGESLSSDNPMVNNITQQVGSQLMKKFGLDSNAVGSVVSTLIPTVLNRLSQKTNDPNDNSFTMDGIINALGSGGGLLGKLRGLFK